MFPYAGNEFIRCQDESKILQLQIVDALRSGERQGASALLFKLIQGNYSLSADDFHDILYYCARSPDPVVSLIYDKVSLWLCLIFVYLSQVIFQ